MFDVNLMTILLRILTPMNPPFCGFDRLPSVLETTPAADLARIKYYRNYLAHLDGSKIGTTVFNTAWTDITGVCIHNCFIELNISHPMEDIRKLKLDIYFNLTLLLTNLRKLFSFRI